MADRGAAAWRVKRVVGVEVFGFAESGESLGVIATKVWGLAWRDQ